MSEKVKKLLKNFPVETFRKNLLDWFRAEKRNLPWREDRDPYKIWVSEVMLQQTRVDTVIPYFRRFMEKYPTLDSLANASEEDLLKVWEGLGYYSRIRNLHSAAREVKERYGGKIPPDPEIFRRLKGVGSYTAGAVMSIAYNLPVPAVDGNVMRVLSRIFRIDDDIAKAKTKTMFEELASELISREDPGSFNQSLMELGALICKPKNPGCLLCPVREQCQAKLAGDQDRYPNKEKRSSGRTVAIVAAVIRDGKGRVFIRKRPETGLLANLWEFPNEEIPGHPRGNRLPQFEAIMCRKHGIRVEVEEPLCRIQHQFSHLKWMMDVFIGKLLSFDAESDSLRAVKPEEIGQYPMPASHQKIWKNYCQFLRNQN